MRLLRLFMALGVLGLALAVTTGIAPSACACSCAPRSPERILADAPAALVGTIVEAEDHQAGGHRYRVRVLRSFKQSLPQTITVVSASTGGACGMSFEPGRDYFMVLGWAGGGVTLGDGEWGASLCSNLSVREEDAVRLAGPALDPEPGASDDHEARSADEQEPRAPLWWGVGGAAVAGLVAAGALVWWRSRRTD